MSRREVFIQTEVGMAQVSFTVQFVGAALGPGDSQGWVMRSIQDNASVAITAIPSNVGGILAVENSRTTRGTDQFGDPIIRRVLCSVRNVGISTVPRYVVNYSVMIP
jgi:hypothetical protein